MKQIILDNIVFSLQKSGGISIVWYELIRRLVQSDYRSRIGFLEYNEAELNLFRSMLDLPTDLVRKIHYRLLSLQRYASPKIKAETPFIFHSSYYRICRHPFAVNITTVHDFTYEYYVTGIKKWIHCWQKYRAICYADYIICVSEHTKRDLLKFLPKINPDRIRVIYNGVSDEYCVLSHCNADLLPFAEKTYALFVGSRVSYKNFTLTVNALKNTEYKLVIVGGSPTLEEQTLLDENMSGRYFFTGRISNEQLNVLYNGAYCLVYPSLYEGFGIPVVEAQKAGCPVIAVNTSSIPEVMGDSSFLLPEATEQCICQRLADLQQADIREQVISRGLTHAKKFTWDHMYAQIEKLYDEIWEGR